MKLNRNKISFAGNFLLILAVAFISSSICCAQKRIEKDAAKSDSSKTSSQVKSSPAYAELLLRRVERESELEEFALDYTDEFPKVREIKFELESINREMNRIAAVSAADAGKLTLALGRMMVRKIEVEIDLWNLQKQYNAEHPEVKRAKKKLEVFERAIKEILP